MKKQAGFTLVEFLIAMAVTAIVVAGTLAAFSDAVRTSDNVTQMSDMTDNLRAGMNLMVQDLVQTGTGIPTGGIPVPVTPNSSTNPTCSTSAPPNRPGPAGGGLPLTFPQCNFTLPAIEPGPNLGPRITSPDTAPGPPSDLLTLMYADYSLGMDATPINRTAGGGLPACAGTINAAGTSVTFDPTCINFATANIPINVGDLIMFSNVNGNALQCVTAVAGQTLTFAAGDPFRLNARPDPQGTLVQIQNKSGSPPAPNGTYPPTSATRIWMVSYYLDNTNDPTHARLVRQINFNPAQPVGETLENLWLTYNYVDGVTNPSDQPGVPAGLTENQIRSVDIFLGARANSPNKSGMYLRNNLWTQVSLRSMAYVNRYN